MKRLTAQDIQNIHLLLEQEFPTMTRGLEKQGLAEAIIEKINREFVIPENENIFLEAATIMEAITRWHIFTDGNKRTGLTAAFTLLYVNDYYLAIPIDAVRFTVNVASNIENEQEDTQKLVKEIADWLQKYSSREIGEFASKVWQYSLWPTMKLVILDFIGCKKYAKRKKQEYFMIKGHEDYEKKYAKEAIQTAGFFFMIVIKTLQQLNKQKKNMAITET